MMATSLRSKLEPIVTTYRRYRLFRALTWCWAMGVGAVVLAWLVKPWLGGFAGSAGWTVALATLGASFWVARKTLREPIDFHWVAEQIEARDPRLRTLLLAAVEQVPDPATGQFSFLQERVIRDAVEQGRQNAWDESFSRGLLKMQAGHLGLLAAFVGMLLVLELSRGPVPGATVSAALGEVSVVPGDATIERGSALIVLARFSGALPTAVALVGSSATEPMLQQEMSRSLEDPVFATSIPEVKSDLVYRVAYDGRQTRDFKVVVFEYPKLERADADVNFPAYTGLPAKRYDDIRRLTAVEGTTVDYEFTLNKPVAKAELRSGQDQLVPLAVDPGRSNVYRARLTLAQSQRLELRLQDEAGRTNRFAHDLVLEVVKNQPPSLKMIFPRGDPKVSPLEELTYQMEVSDDFGVKAFGIAYELAGGATNRVELGRDLPAKEKHGFRHLVALETLEAEANQVMSYYLWADDIGPDGQLRRTEGDMYFAEVRPFEIVFREGQSSEEPGGSESGQQGSPALRLAQLQKEIIAATWKLKRREPPEKPTEAFPKDAEVVRESQAKALAQVEKLKESAGDQLRSVELVEVVEKQMRQAVEHLTQAAEKQDVKALVPALAAEQAAYRALLRLDERERQIVRGSPSSQGQGADGMQDQIQELDLKQSENRYENQRQAAAQETPEQREQREALARLKELAQRQQDVNERLQELQTALQEAKNEAEREEVRRQLKRLREEQQEIVQGMDELQQKLARSENQANVGAARDQLEQTRAQAMEAANQLEKEAISQALNSGTRAQRSLEEMRDEFRKKNSSQFADDLRRMRNEAREMTERQRDIAQQLQENTTTRRRTLSDTDERTRLTSQFEQQQSAVTNLMQNMRRVSEAAEVSEPLVSKHLYDALRRTDQASVDQALESSAELFRRGFRPQASRMEEKARGAMDELQRGVEQAAESVLGDEAEALRRAKRELESLASELERELDRENATANAAPGTTGADPSGDEGSQTGGAAQRRDPGSRRADRGTNQTQLASAAVPGANGVRTNTPAGAGSGREQDDAATAGAERTGGRRGRTTNPRPGQAEQGEGAPRQLAAAGNTEESSPSEQGEGGPQPGQGQQGQGQQGQGQQGQGQQGQGQQGQGQQGQGQQGQGQQGQGQQGQGQQGRQPGSGRGRGAPGTEPSERRERLQAGNREGGIALRMGEREGSAAGAPENSGPITGQDFSQWSDRLSQVEEMLDDPALRNQVAEAREQARQVRSDLKRHSKGPQWDMVRDRVLQPLVEVRQRVSEALAKRESPDALVPIDRDPVPEKFADKVRRYYEELGKNQ